MSSFFDQHVLKTDRIFRSSGPTEKLDLSCKPEEALFQICLEPLTSITPAVIAIFLLFVRLLHSYTRHYPRWMRPFINELNGKEHELQIEYKKRYANSTTALLIIIPIGLALHVATLLYPAYDVRGVFPALAWAVIALLATIDRPHTAPLGILLIVISLFVMRLAQLVAARSNLHAENIVLYLGLIPTFLAILVILCMPFRDPEIPHDQISSTYEKPTSELRSPEDNLMLWQFMTVSWMSPLITLGSARQLNDEDVWSLSFEFQHKTLHENFRKLKGSVVRRLLTANGIDLVIISSLAVVSSLARLSEPVLLQQILRAMEDPEAPRRDAATFAMLALIARLVAMQSSILHLWYSRRCYERSRGEMITMIFEKTLARKIVSAPKRSKPEEHANGDAGCSSKDTKRSSFHPCTLWGKVYVQVRGFFCARPESKEANEPASMGKILNLMRNDVYEVSQRFWEFGVLITTPLKLTLSTVLVWRLLGWPCLFGVVTIFVAQGVNAIITKVLLRWERLRRKATDSKLQKISQFVEAIRHLRWYGWQDFWKDQIMQSRQEELNLRVITGLWRTLITFVNTFASGLFPVTAFYAYTVWAGLPLRIDIAFPALQLFGILENNLRGIPNLITTLLNAKIAVDRIENFMSEPDRDLGDIPTHSGDTQLMLRDASFAWPGTSDPVLQHISLAFPVGLTVICGKVAAGKTALLQALLGELDRLEGDATVPSEMIGYCAQTPWLQSMNIRDNILFSSPFEEARYKETLEACALTQDLAGFKDGDLSNIGENGIGLSGGQKARVALVRAVYSRAKVLLLDDPLSALDHQTASTIVRKCLDGPLVDGRTVVLVTHRTELCHGLAKQMIEISDGRARLLDPESEVSNEATRVMSSESEDPTDNRSQEQEKAAVPTKFIEDEKRAHGGVKASVYWEYIKAGKLTWWAVLICMLVLNRLADVGETWFLKSWGESYDKPSVQIMSGPFDGLPSPEVNIRPWLLGFFLFAAVQSILYFISQAIMLAIIYFAGRRMFREVLDRVSHATFRFYDVTPVGRLMNRMTSDIGTVDGNISSQFSAVAWLAIKWATSLVIIASVTPVFLVFALMMTASFVVIFNRFLPTSQSLRRLEMVSLSPLMSNFGALLEGLATVRAFSVQSRFQDRIIEVTDAFQKMDHFYWSLQAWLMYRFEVMSSTSTFLITLLALYTGVSPGLTAFLLTAAAQFVMATHSLCKQYGALQMDFVSVERVVELLHLEQEPKGDINPPAAWPSYAGDIVFEDVTMRYAPHLDPALSNISFRIPAGSTAALLGRTGSGKSTLALALLATIRPESGRILIDNVDIATVNTQALRNRVTFLAQDPVLFPGAMRHNLDPLDEYSSDACSAVLDRVCNKHNWDLETQVDAGGKNFSQGQRQLVGLARAVLRRSSIVILDEATASIDKETAMEIQQILREEMRESTVITIAHRLEAVRDADLFIRLEKGRVAAMGAAPVGYDAFPIALPRDRVVLVPNRQIEVSQPDLCRSFSTHTVPRKRQALKVQKAVICILANDPTPIQANDEAIEKAGDAVIDRIKKCFARAKHANANEAEVRAAFKMADRIIKQHGLESYREMMQEDQTQRLKRGGMSKVNIWPANEEGCAVMQGWVNWLFNAIKIFFDCDAYSTEYAKEIEWTFYGIAEHTVSAAIAFEAVHNQIQEWAAQVKGVSTRNSYSLGVADGLLTLAEKTKKKTEEEARQYEARALAARIREEDMKRQTELYKLRNPSPEPTPELESEDGMDLDETDNPGDTEGADDTGDVSDNEVMPNYSERHDAAAPAIAVDMKADFDTELNKFMVPDPVAPTNNPGLPSRTEFLDDDDAALPSTEEADEPTEMEETAAWKSMRQLSHWREMSKDIANDVLADHKIKLKKGRKVKRSVKDKDAFKKGQKDSEKIEIQAARIEQGEGTEDVKPEEADSAMIIDG